MPRTSLRGRAAWSIRTGIQVVRSVGGTSSEITSDTYPGTLPQGNSGTWPIWGLRTTSDATFASWQATYPNTPPQAIYLKTSPVPYVPRSYVTPSGFHYAFANGQTITEWDATRNLVKFEPVFFVAKTDALTDVFPYANSVRVVGVPIRAPAEFPRVRPREEPVPSFARPQPLIRPGAGFEVRPNGQVRPLQSQAKPPRRTSENKTGAAAASAAVARVVDAFNTVTEVADVLAIFWDHLGPRAGESFYDTMKRYVENPDLWAQVDWEGMVRDMIANEVEDEAIGRLHGLKRRLRTERGEPIYGSVFAHGA